MEKWEKCVLTEDNSILDTLKAINESTMQVALIVDAQKKLLGIATDGDIRRALLNDIDLKTCITKIMNTKPIIAKNSDKKEDILRLMQIKQISQVPIVDENGTLVNFTNIKNMFEKKAKENIVFILAGGEGTRLRPLTNDCPKPMLLLNGKPILEIILENFIGQGFNKFYFAINYKAEKIVDYFENGSKWNAEIKYIYEKKQLGTAGALSLIEDKPDKNIIVVNGDVLAKIDFTALLDYCETENTDAVMAVKEYKIQIPYGVVKVVDNHKIIAIEEKPTEKYLVNTGVYVLNPKILEYIPQDMFFDMPTLFAELISKGHKTAVFHLDDYWIDIGQKEDYEYAKSKYSTDFNM